MTTLLDALTGALPDGRGAALCRLGADLPPPEGAEGLPPALRPFLAGAARAAPYLGRLMRRCDVVALLARDAGVPVSSLAPAPGAPEGDALRTALRRAKADAALVVALMDLGGAWDMRRATEALSGFADACIEAALRGAWAEVAGHRKADVTLPPGAGPVLGLGVVAMGKLGSRTLNYSSDVDLIAVYDADALPLGPDDRLGPRGAAVAVTQAMLAILSDRTTEGYVFRTDMRLRPDPGSSALAVSAQQAERYYERQGQNWERAAHIKARGCAGDGAVTNAYLDILRPFVWRRALDFAALADIRAVGQQIQAQAGRPDLAVPGADVKLGPGGIREAEFLCEVQQLVFGGRDEGLRTARTLDTLPALAAAGLMPEGTARAVADAYVVLRDAEHRVQMVQDEPTQTLPEDDGARAGIAALYGTDLARFDAEVLAALSAIHDAYAEVFAPEADEEQLPGSLVFTGVDEDPRTVRTLGEMGFADPRAVARAVRGWHQGVLPAAKSARARELLTALVPRILSACAATGTPDAAFEATGRFLSVLPASLGVFGLFTANPEVLADVVTLCAASPDLARRMGRRPNLVMALLSGEEDAPPPPRGADLEAEMDAVRRHAQAERLRAAARLTLGRGDPYEAGAGLAALADEGVSRLSDAVRDGLADPGPPLAVLAFGRLGAGCLTVASDLDLVLVYEGGPGAASAALKRVRRLVAALSAPTAEGVLYEVDMKLRPSGGAGPAAVSLSAFERYYEEAAWGWELMALTKARVVLADGDLGARVDAVVARALTRERDAGALRAEAASMRGRLLEGHPPRGPLDVKRMAGGLTDVDFVAQASSLTVGKGAAGEGARPPRGAPDALRAHEASGRLDPDDAALLLGAHRLFEGVAQYARATFGTVPAGGLTASQEAAVAKLCGTARPIEDEVAEAAGRVAAAFERLVGPYRSVSR